MEIRLPAEQAAFIQELVDAGHFLAPDEAIITAVWLLKDEYSLYKVKRDELRKLLQVGIDQLERGESAPLDMQAILAKTLDRARRQQESHGSPK